MSDNSDDFLAGDVMSTVTVSLTLAENMDVDTTDLCEPPNDDSAVA